MINLGSLGVNKVAYIPFNTFDSNGASATVSGLVASGVHIHKEGDVAQRTSSAGITVFTDFDGVTGNHLIKIDLSDNTDPDFYESGNDYSVRAEGLTVDSQNLNVWLGSFSIENRSVDTVKISGDSDAADNLESQYDETGLVGGTFPSTQDQISGIANTGAAINKVCSGATVNTGIETNTYVATQALDGVEHSIEEDANAISVDYNFNIGGTGVPVSITISGRLYDPPVTGDTIQIQAYDWITTTWKDIGSLDGVNSSVNSPKTVILFSSMVGTGADAGEVDIRFTGTGLGNNTELFIDLLYCSYSVVSSAVGYANGAIWIDTTNGVSGTVRNVNGTADNPVLTYSDALVLAASTKLARFEVAPAGSIQLISATSGFDYQMNGSAFDLNGQTIADCTITGARLTGIGLSGGGSLLFFDRALVGTVTLPPCILLQSGFTDTLTFGSSGTYLLDACASAVAGSGSPVFDFNSVSNINLNIRHYSGGVQIENMVATDKMSLEGWGQLIIDSSCTGGEIVVRGSFKITDNSGGAVSIDDTANFKDTVIDSDFAQSSTSNTIVLSTNASSVDGAYDPVEIFIYAGTGAGQSRMGLEYIGASRTLIVDRNWKVNPDATSKYRLLSNPGREHVNEGLAQAGSSNTITLNALASSVNDAYKNQLIFIRSGTGEDQVGVCVAYNGTTKVATIEGTWGVTPDETSGYSVLPFITYDKTGYSIAGTLNTLDDLENISVSDIVTHVVEGTLTLEQVLRVVLSGVALKSSGGGTPNISFRDLADGKNRITGVVDASNNRLSVTLDGS